MFIKIVFYQNFTKFWCCIAAEIDLIPDICSVNSTFSCNSKNNLIYNPGAKTYRKLWAGHSKQTIDNVSKGKGEPYFCNKPILACYFKTYINRIIKQSQEQQNSTTMNFQFQIIPYEQTIRPQTTLEKVPDPIPQNSPRKTLRNKATKTKIQPTEQKQINGWNLTEERLYVKFISEYGHLLQLQKKEKKRLKVNVRMSKAIKTRDPSQCHSHHQKLLLKYGSIEGIVNNFEYLGQGKSPKAKQIKGKQFQEPSVSQEQVFDLNLQVLAQYYEGKQVQFLQMREMNLQSSYHFKFKENWDDQLL